MGNTSSQIEEEELPDIHKQFATPVQSQTMQMTPKWNAVNAPVVVPMSQPPADTPSSFKKPSKKKRDKSINLQSTAAEVPSPLTSQEPNSSKNRKRKSQELHDYDHNAASVPNHVSSGQTVISSSVPSSDKPSKRKRKGLYNADEVAEASLAHIGDSVDISNHHRESTKRSNTAQRDASPLQPPTQETFMKSSRKVKRISHGSSQVVVGTPEDYNDTTTLASSSKKKKKKKGKDDSDRSEQVVNLGEQGSKPTEADADRSAIVSAVQPEASTQGSEPPAKQSRSRKRASGEFQREEEDRASPPAKRRSASIEDDIAASSQLLLETQQRAQELDEIIDVDVSESQANMPVTVKKLSKKQKKNQKRKLQRLAKQACLEASEDAQFDGMEVPESPNAQPSDVEMEEERAVSLNGRDASPELGEPFLRDHSQNGDSSLLLGDESHAIIDNTDQLLASPERLPPKSKKKSKKNDKMRKITDGDVPELNETLDTGQSADDVDVRAATEAEQSPAAEEEPGSKEQRRKKGSKRKRDRSEELGEPVTHEEPTVKSKKRKRRSTAQVEITPVASVQDEPQTIDDQEATSRPKKRKTKVAKQSEETVQTTAQANKKRKSSSKRASVQKENTDLDIIPEGAIRTEGNLTPYEISLLKRAVGQYAEENDLTSFQVNELIHKDRKKTREETGELWEAITTTLPMRNSQQLAKSVRRAFNNKDARGKWTPQQDDELRQAYALYGNAWAKIGRYIDRFADDCRDRVRNYLEVKNQVKGDWSGVEEERLLTVAGELAEKVKAARREAATENGTVYDEASFNFERDLDWRAVASEVGTRSRMQCRYKWKSMLDRFEKNNYGNRESEEEIEEEDRPLERKDWRIKRARQNYKLMEPGDKYQILGEILDFGARNEYAINWLQIKKAHPDSKWGIKERKLVLKEAKKMVAAYEGDLQEMLTEIRRQMAMVLDVGAFYEGVVVPSTQPRKKKGRKSKKFVEDEIEDVEDDDGGESGGEETEVDDEEL